MVIHHSAKFGGQKHYGIHHPAKFGGQKHYGNIDMFLILISQNHVIKGSSDFMAKSLTR